PSLLSTSSIYSVYVTTPTRLPPTPTLFPYTTLFRSGDDDVLSARSEEPADPPPAARARRDRDPVPRPWSCVVERKLRARSPLGEDRKSTRLNSSHVSISYAVFCLKKKIVKSRITS